VARQRRHVLIAVAARLLEQEYRMCPITNPFLDSAAAGH
jgi:hypothetical protein